MEKLICLFLYLLSFNCISAFASDKPEIRLTTEILNWRYCKGDWQLDRLDLQLKLRFENIGQRPIILYKNSEQVVRTIISENRGGAVGNVEVNSSITWVTSGNWKVDESSLSKSFTVVQPGKYFETKTTAGVFTTRPGVVNIAGAVADGEHFVQFRVATWPGWQEQADRLQQSWKETGFLWTNSVLSEPMKFKIDAKRKLARCE